MKTRPAPPSRRLARRRHERRGRLAEVVAATLLRLKGYRIVAARARLPGGEIDLIVRRGPVTAFVEVKQRPRHGEAMAAVSRRQTRRIVRAAHAWLARHPEHLERDCRFDIVVVNSYLWPRHIADAFTTDNA